MFECRCTAGLVGTNKLAMLTVIPHLKIEDKKVAVNKTNFIYTG
jgi:hypothetical protein